ncbi:FmdB family transcriptional regulator [Brachybacterium alimentarium]|uniref:FmdB family transcriptional regulator n=1 Tax=Brachybacterium alimentarium TaxID=47845 RepID=A0A2A3YK29_9MICO|nr:FmdB family zinc ribbon protein [Brachybacterium alimentarium]PCC39653.1 FmdB family transcriptional regulator [Brachybacterium alimentarium]RCS69689.1 FmdB family transcriptional regulator [Brachybacterium alimentarium]RCS76252.1 FmdB family transcriptional regulator [Brachybacterium alimentarium]RCS85383.1 FmdB family transcriptional regulator [Brachybacterium alimentarium]RCS85592.1 FmdB family transcriptional regulator [Brachybacterium alimentarium]
MPTYVYACKNCGHRFEQYQSFSDASLVTCPECTQETLRKVFDSVGIVFKGPGFYSTDSASSGASSSGSSAASGTGDSSTESSSAARSSSDSSTSTSTSTSTESSSAGSTSSQPAPAAS